MQTKTKAWISIAMACLALEAWALFVVSASPTRWSPSLIVRDEPAAHTRYEVMLQTLQEAKGLSYMSTCSGPDERPTFYRVWLKKPGSLRVAVSNYLQEAGTLVCDGNDLWIFWEGHCPLLHADDPNTGQTSKVYIRRPASAGGLSISSEIALLKIAWYNIILDPSLFHGYPNPLGPSIDGVRSRGHDRVGNEECDVIEVSYNKARQIRYYWISRQDSLPRQIKEVKRLADDTATVTVEEWIQVSLNPEIPSKLLTWSPPEGWRPWNLPPSGSGRL